MTGDPKHTTPQPSQTEDTALVSAKLEALRLLSKSGGRSGKAAQALIDAGFNNVSNLVGGILRWSDEVDPTIPKY